MQALLFEMKPRDGHEEHYFRHAAKLRPLLMKQEGLIFIERFKSMTRPGVILSHSLWRDEAAIAKWRTDGEHHKSQAAGRHKHFEDYRIRISHVLQYFEPGDQLKEWSTDGAYSDPAASASRFMTIVRAKEKPFSGEGEVFESVTEAASFLCVEDVASEEDGCSNIRDAQGDDAVLSATLSRVSRDYGMYERAEAPQYFEPVE